MVKETNGNEQIERKKEDTNINNNYNYKMSLCNK